MTSPIPAARDSSPGAAPAALPDEVAAQIQTEQAHVDRVYAELAKAADRAKLVEQDGLARGRTSRVGDVRDEELTGLFERDALVYNAARRRHALDSQYEGLVFGRLDLQEEATGDGDVPPATPTGRQVRYIGRLGVRDDDYEPLVIDWRAPAAAPFYRATPVDPHGVLRRRVLSCRGPRVVGIEDDLMVAEPPEDLVVVGDGALLAALTRSRGARMRDIVATIQAHQDQAIRSPAAGVTEITGGPGTGKTVVALHRAAYLLYADRRRYEHGGILVVGPSTAYTAYIERVLPSLGEESVTVRSLGDLVDAVTATRLDEPVAASVKGSNRMRRVLSALAHEPVPGAPQELRFFAAGHAIRLDAPTLESIRLRVLRNHQRNLGTASALAELTAAAFRQTTRVEPGEFADTMREHPDVQEFLAAWWPQLDPREMLLWLADDTLAARVAHRVLDADEIRVLARSMRTALELGSWSVADVPLIDDLSVRLSPVVPERQQERGFFEIETFDDLSGFGIEELHPSVTARELPTAQVSSADPRERLLQGRIDRAAGYAHLLVDEAQDLSPMQWRMLGRRGRTASWTVVGDAAQSSWPDPAESATARDEAFADRPRRSFHMTTNYRNSGEVFDYAARLIRAVVPDADIPVAVRRTGVPVEEVTGNGRLVETVRQAAAAALAEVDGSVAVIVADPVASGLARLDDLPDDRLVVLDPLTAKGLEFDATVVVDPDRIVADTAGGARSLYVALTRAAHRMVVVRP